jgi:hypothetical protein
LRESLARHRPAGQKVTRHQLSLSLTIQHPATSRSEYCISPSAYCKYVTITFASFNTVMRPFLRPPWPQAQLLRWHLRAPQSIPRRIATTSAANAAPIDIPKLILSPGSNHHNSLSSFVDYAKRTKLATNTSIYVGTHYEYTTALSLLRLGFSLLRIGRKFDAGIDLIGHWVLAPLREPLRVIIQCKARNISISPCHVREMEGSFQAVPAGWKKQDVLGLLATTHKATKGTLKALGESRWPLGFVMISHDGCIQQFVWNRAAAERGLEGVGVTLRHTPRVLLPESIDKGADVKVSKTAQKLAKFKNTGTKKDIQLTWMGTPIFPDRETLDEDTLKLMKAIALTAPTSKAEPQETPVKPARPTKSGKPDGRFATTPTKLLPPSPRGGMVRGPPGRPKGSITALRICPVALLTNNRGRPRGSKSAQKAPKEIPEIRGRGRPKGSKNKPKIEVDAG